MELLGQKMWISATEFQTWQQFGNDLFSVKY